MQKLCGEGSEGEGRGGLDDADLATRAFRFEGINSSTRLAGIARTENMDGAVRAAEEMAFRPPINLKPSSAEGANLPSTLPYWTASNAICIAISPSGISRRMARRRVGAARVRR